MRWPFNADQPSTPRIRDDGTDNPNTARSHHWDRRSCTIAIILMLVFAGAVFAAWSTLTADIDPDIEFIVTPSPTENGIEDERATPTSS